MYTIQCTGTQCHYDSRRMKGCRLLFPLFFQFLQIFIILSFIEIKQRFFNGWKPSMLFELYSGLHWISLDHIERFSPWNFSMEWIASSETQKCFNQSFIRVIVKSLWFFQSCNFQLLIINWYLFIVKFFITILSFFIISNQSGLHGQRTSWVEQTVCLSKRMPNIVHFHLFQCYM